jgi:hypothetical protein
MRDKINIGDIITIMAGGTKRKIKITGKAWVPETEMSDNIRAEIGSKVPKQVGFSGAFQITFDYEDGSGAEDIGEEPKDEKLDLISKKMDEDL